MKKSPAVANCEPDKHPAPLNRSYQSRRPEILGTRTNSQQAQKVTSQHQTPISARTHETMGRELQKRKRRSLRPKVTMPARRKKALNPLGNGIIAKNWYVFPPSSPSPASHPQ